MYLGIIYLNKLYLVFWIEKFKKGLKVNLINFSKTRRKIHLKDYILAI